MLARKNSSSKTAIKQRCYRARTRVGLRFWGFYAEEGLVEHALHGVSDKLSPGDHSYATLKRALADHLVNEWLAGWRQEWMECEALSAPQGPQSDADDPLWFWS